MELKGDNSEEKRPTVTAQSYAYSRLGKSLLITVIIVLSIDDDDSLRLSSFAIAWVLSIKEQLLHCFSFLLGGEEPLILR